MAYRVLSAVHRCPPLWPRARARPASTMSAPGPVATSIARALVDTFHPEHLDVLNESHLHSVPAGSETHFKVVVVSTAFAGQSVLARHRAVNGALSSHLQHGVHALSIVAKTPEQWQESSQVSASPPCLGGAKHERRGDAGGR